MKKGLGRGLGALFDMDGSQAETAGTEAEDRTGRAETLPPNASGVTELDIRKIEPNQQQPRQYFNDEALQELAESIRSYGIVQPLIVKDCGSYYTIIAGERRFRAARLAKLDTIPAIIKDYSEMEILQIALIENIQRQDLTPIEEATCYKRLIEDFFFTQEDIAQKIGKNRNAISNAVRLLELDSRVQGFVSEGKLTASHARMLLAVKDNEIQYKCAEQIISEALSVRGAEGLVAAMLNSVSDQKDKKLPNTVDDSDEASRVAYRRAEDELKALFGAKVNIHYGKKKGKIEIEYYTPDDLDRLLCLFKNLNGSTPNGE